MKKMLLLILLSLIIGVGIANAQTTKYYNWGSIEMRIKVSVDNGIVEDTNTLFTINCMSDKISFNTHSSRFSLILHPNKEYNITVYRGNCITKNIYVNTVGVNTNETYIVDNTISLKTGSGDYAVYSGKITYDRSIDNFVANHKHKQINYERINR